MDSTVHEDRSASKKLIVWINQIRISVENYNCHPKNLGYFSLWEQHCLFFADELNQIIFEFFWKINCSLNQELDRPKLIIKKNRN
jgi:hypothetical protein